jgi:L-serine dehydratase
VGGGFIHAAGESQVRQGAGTGAAPIPFAFDTMDQLLAHGRRTGLSIPEMLRANELAHMDEAQLETGIDRIWQVMRDCIAKGLATGGQLPGGLIAATAPTTCRTTPCTR